MVGFSTVISGFLIFGFSLRIDRHNDNPFYPHDQHSRPHLTDVQVDISVDTRPVIILHEGTASFVNSKVVTQIIGVQSEKFLTGETVIGWNAEATLKEKEAIL